MPVTEKKISVTTPTRPAPPRHTSLDDAIAFGHEPCNWLARGEILHIRARHDAAYEAFDQAANSLAALVAEQPDASALLATSRNMSMSLDIAGEQNG